MPLPCLVMSIVGSVPMSAEIVFVKVSKDSLFMQCNVTFTLCVSVWCVYVFVDELLACDSRQRVFCRVADTC